MRHIVSLIIVIVVLALGWLMFWPIGIDPVAWSPPEDKGYSGPLAPNNKLAAMERIADGLGLGPEDVAFDGAGRLYTGLDDGRIMRLDLGTGEAEEFANTGGRPLGMVFDQAGDLIVADAYEGLLSVSQDGVIKVLATGAEGLKFGLTDDLDIAADGTIYFTDASTRFDVANSLSDLIEHRGSGRLLAFDPGAGEVRVLLRGLQFANGVAMSPDQNYLLVNETGAYRVMRYWLGGPDAGTSEVFIDNLPGYPDNVNSGSGGMFWIALPAPRVALLDRLAPYPFLVKMAVRLLGGMPEPEPHVAVIGVDGDGRVVDSFQDPQGGYHVLTSAVEHDGKLYVGSIAEAAIGVVTLP